MLQQEDLAQVAQQVADELREVDALVGEALHELQRLGGAALETDVGDLEEQVGARDAERLEHVGRVDRPLAVGDELLERADGVAEAALRVARDLDEGRLLDLDRRPAALVVGALVLALDDARQELARCRATWGRRKSKRWQRETMVSGILCGSVVASTKTTFGGGSSSVFSRALKASRVSMWTSSMM